MLMGPQNSMKKLLSAFRPESLTEFMNSCFGFKIDGDAFELDFFDSEQVDQLSRLGLQMMFAGIGLKVIAIVLGAQ